MSGPCILPRVETIKVMIKQTDLENRWITNTKGQPIASFQPSSMDICYKFPYAKKNMDVEWYESATKEVNKLALIKNWSVDCKRFKLSTNGLYKI